MNANRVILLLSVLLFASISWHMLSPSPEPWKPVLEDTSFRSLAAAAERAGTAVNDIRRELEEGRPRQASAALDNAELRVRQLTLYYLPLIEVRQLLYDADRLAYLGEMGQAERKLQEAKATLTAMGNQPQLRLGEVVVELMVQIDRAILTAARPSAKLFEQLRELGHHVNLMVLKGDLELSD